MSTHSSNSSTEPISVFKTTEGEALYMAAYATSMSLWPVEYETLTLNTSFARTHVIVSGPKDAPPLVLLHGYGFTSIEWYANVSAFSRYYRTYAIDIPGQVGKSFLLKPIKTPADFTIWLNEVFDALQIKQPYIIGHSYGGWLAVSFALSAPERVSKLVLLAPGASFKPLVPGFFVRGMLCTFLPTRFLVRRLLEWIIARENRAKMAAQPYLFEQTYLSFKYFKPSTVVAPKVYSDYELKQLTMPVLLLLGEEEVIYNVPAVVCRAGRLLPNLQVGLVPGAGHGLNLEQPELVSDTILKFLNPQFQPKAEAVPLAVLAGSN
jgi:pimeloyl-ACP methyl ester carboxylesterase